MAIIGGGGHSTHILVGMCHGEVKNVGLWNGLSVKMLVSGAGASVKRWVSEAGSRVKLVVSGADCRTRLAAF